MVRTFGVHPLGCRSAIPARECGNTLKGGHRTAPRYAPARAAAGTALRGASSCIACCNESAACFTVANRRGQFNPYNTFDPPGAKLHYRASMRDCIWLGFVAGASLLFPTNATSEQVSTRALSLR